MAVVMVGCASYGTAPAPATGAGQTGAAPTVKIVSPTDGDKIAGGTVTLKIEATGITLKAPGGTDKVGEGHLHVWLDNSEEAGYTQLTKEYKNVAAGKHTIVVEVRHNNHGKYNPEVKASVSFEVTGGAASGTQPSSSTKSYDGYNY